MFVYLKSHFECDKVIWITCMYVIFMSNKNIPIKTKTHEAWKNTSIQTWNYSGEGEVILRKKITITYKYEFSFSKNIQNEMPKAYLVDDLMEVR